MSGAYRLASRLPRQFAEEVAPPLAAGPVLLGVAMTGLGARGVLAGVPIAGWQPLAEGPLATVFARADGLALVALGLMIATGVRRRAGALGLSVLLTVWLLALQSPGLLSAPMSIALWLGAAEVGAVAAGALLLGISGSGSSGRSTATAARCGFGLCAAIFGISHFAYARFTAGMVPGWLPFRLGLAYATGGAHLVAGLAIASGTTRRAAAGLLACMMGSFVLLVHVPAVVGSGWSLTQVTFLLDASALCASAWIVAATTPKPASGPHPARAGAIGA